MIFKLYAFKKYFSNKGEIVAQEQQTKAEAKETTVSQENLGQLFRETRQALNLSLEDVSKKIQLRPVILQQLEDNQFTSSTFPASFIQGYIRSYAKFLRIPESQYIGVVNSLSSKNYSLRKNLHRNKALNEETHRSGWMSFISMIVLVLLFAMTALWWWENYQQKNQERENLVSQYEVQQEKKSQEKYVQPLEPMFETGAEPSLQEGEMLVPMDKTENAHQVDVEIEKKP